MFIFILSFELHNSPVMETELAPYLILQMKNQGVSHLPKVSNPGSGRVRHVSRSHQIFTKLDAQMEDLHQNSAYYLAYCKC